MPPSRRSSRQSSKTTNGTHKESDGKIKEADQWVFLMNESALEEDQNVENKPVFCKIRHPKTEQGSLFLFTHGDTNVYEVSAYNDSYKSWFIEETVQHDGRLLITTPVDPLFLTLPYLVKAEKTGKFMTLDQIVLDDDYPECSRLTSTNGMSELDQIADAKGDEDFKAFKLNTEKLMSWLQAKTDKLADTLSNRGFCVSGGQTATYIRSKRSMSTSSEDYQRYAYGMLSDYLSADLAKNLMEHMGITLVVEKKEPAEPPSKKAKNGDITPTEDYSKAASEQKTAKGVKLSSAQKQLSKVDKSGMKSMMSFFSPKAKT